MRVALENTDPLTFAGDERAGSVRSARVAAGPHGLRKASRILWLSIAPLHRLVRKRDTVTASVHPQDSQRDRASSSPFEPLAVGHRDDCRIEHALCAGQMRPSNGDAPPIDR